MSGQGDRFKRVGYKNPKPLIEVEGSPIIQHVVNMFSNVSKITFICNEEHMNNTDMRNKILNIYSDANIRVIPCHKKGPVYSISQIYEDILDTEKVIISYCDFNSYWSFFNFLIDIEDSDGAIPSYKGFHPHMLGSDNYAFIREQDRFMLEIQEKMPFTNNKMEEYASNGVYYFRTGALLKKYASKLMELNIQTNNEFYVSMIYNLMTQDQLKIKIYPVQYMLQWGTPKDLEEYVSWSNYFKDIIKIQSPCKNPPETITVLPLAGHGSRFKMNGYSEPKPLLDICGYPMVVQAIRCLPNSDKNIFICLEEHLKEFPLIKHLKEYDNTSEVISINHVTDGQACTCEIGLLNVSEDTPICITACDNGVYYDTEKYNKLVSDESVDVIIWSFKNHASSSRYPHMYSWLKVDENDNILEVSVKNCKYDEPEKGHAIIGTMFFRKKRYFSESLKKIYEKDIRTNGEFYVDNLLNDCIQAGLKVKQFCVTNYICWGTPNDYETFLYWQSYFNKTCKNQSDYEISRDIYSNKNKIEELRKKLGENAYNHVVKNWQYKDGKKRIIEALKSIEQL